MGSNHVDRLSNMTDEVLSEILSLMPTKFAVRTSILSKKWRYKWTLVTNVDIDVLPFHGLLNCCAFVDRVLDLCKTTEIKLFRLRFSNLWVEKSRMTRWINEAVRLKVKELDIQSVLLDWHLSLLNCNTLTKLTIENNMSSEVVLDWQTPFNFPCVKTLDVAVFCNPSRNALKLICGCPVLESLSLRIVVCSDREEECRFDISTLKHLKLEMLKWGYPKKVVLNVPNLEDLTIGGHWGTLFVMEDLSSLVSVTLSLGDLMSNNFGVVRAELLKGIIAAKSLKLNICYSGLPDAPLPNFPNLKHLELTGGSNLKPLIMFQFLESCSELEYLSIKIIRSRFDEPEKSCWIEPHSVPSCMLKNLSTMKYEINMGRIDNIQFLEYLLGNAEVLRKLTITCKSGLVEDEMWLCGKLLKCQRASRYCEIHFVGN